MQNQSKFRILIKLAKNERRIANKETISCCFKFSWISYNQNFLLESNMLFTDFTEQDNSPTQPLETFTKSN